MEISCPAFRKIRIADLSFGDSICPAYLQLRQNIEYMYLKSQCNDLNTCYVKNNYYSPRIASIYFDCEGLFIET